LNRTFSKPKVLILLVFIITCLIFSVITFIVFRNTNPLDELSFLITDNKLTVEVKIWQEKQEGMYYLFLPSYADINHIQLKSPQSYVVRMSNISYTDSDLLQNLALDTVCDMSVLSRGNGRVLDSYKLTIIRSENLPAAFITSENISELNKGTVSKASGTLTLITSTGNVDYRGALDAIQKHGSSTWKLLKKPYDITLADRCGLLGMTASKKWVLQANYRDGSYLRNYIAFQTARMVGMAYVPDSRFIDLYIDGIYAGNYQLTETIEVGSSKVNINDLEKTTQTVNNQELSNFKSYSNGQQKGSLIPINPPDITGGYLIEGSTVSDNDPYDGDGFKTSSQKFFKIKAPAFITQAQVDYISTLMQEIETAIYSENGFNALTGKYYTDLVDIDSWAKMYLIDEIFQNPDGGIRSEFFYKDSDSVDSHVYAGPAWDYDASIGNGSPWLVNPDIMMANRVSWYSKLYLYKDFYAELCRQYSEKFKPVVEELLESEIDDYEKILEKSAQMDYIRWSHAIHSVSQVTTDPNTLSSQIDYLKTYLRDRLKFLDSYWLGNDKYYTVLIFYNNASNTAVDSDDVYHSRCFCIRQGSLFQDLPIPKKTGYLFTGYDDQSSGEKFDKDQPIFEDKVLRARWALANDTSNNIKIVVLSYIEQYYEIIPPAVLSGALVVIGIRLLYKNINAKKKAKRRRSDD
jgi:hypothetical protein